MVALNCRVILSSVKAVQVFLGRRWDLTLDLRANLSSVKAVLVVLWGCWLDGWSCLILGQVWPLHRRFGWFLGVWGVGA